MDEELGAKYLLLLLLPQCKQRHTRHLDNLESDTTNITLCLSLLTEPSNQNLYSLAPLPESHSDTIVLINEIETTVIWHETCYPTINTSPTN